MTMERKYRIQRTTKACEVIKDQQVYAEYQELTKSWKIHNVKGKPFDIPADKLYHPFSKFFKNDTRLNWLICNLRINKWKRKYERVIKKLNIKDVLKYKLHMDRFGVFVIVKGSKTKEFYFQFRKEDFKRFKEFINI